MKRLRYLVLAALVACSGPAQKPAKPAPPSPPVAEPEPQPQKVTPPANPDDAPLAMWSAVKKGKLANGLTYYVLPHKKPENRALLWMAVNAGSVQEDDDQRGLAHFIEHMAFNGTTKFPENKLIKYLESLGIRFGADLNAHTWWEETVYKLEVPSDKPENLTTGLDVLRDWASDITFDPKELEKERGVVMEEWRLGRGAGMRLFDKHALVQFKGSRYANRITIGLPEVLQKAPREVFLRYYKDWYRPDLMAVIAVGDFDAAKIEAEIKARFGTLKNPASPRQRIRGGVPPADGGTRVSIETDREATSTTVTIQNLVAHRPEASKNDFRRLLAEQLYSSILNERFSTIGRTPDAPFISASGGISNVVRDIDGFSRFASAKEGKLEDTLRAVLTEVVRVEKHGITSSELERARTRTIRRMEQMAETEATRDSREFVEEMIRNFYEGEFMVGSQREKDLALEILPTLTLAELNQLGAKFGGANGRVVMISGPEGKPLPTKERVLAIVDEVGKANVTPWEDKAPQAGLMAAAPKAGKIVKEAKNDKVGVTEWTLSNGARVIVKPTDFEIDNVSLTGLSPGGEAMTSDKDFPHTRWADEVVSIGGVGELDVDELGKVLAGKQVRVSTSIGELTESIDAGGSVRDLETMMQLVYLRMTAPRKDAQAFGVWRANFAEQITNALRSPEFRYQRESTKELWKNHVRRRTPEPDEITKIDLDKALAFYKNRFGDATDFTFVIVGAVDLAKLKPLVETYLASLPAKGRKEKEKNLKIKKVGGVVKKTFKLGAEPKASVRLDFHGNEKWSRDKDRDMYILGQVLSMRLRETMREDKGGVYGVGASGRVARAPLDDRSFTVGFGCDPTRVDELTKAAIDGAELLKKEDTPADVLDRVKQQFLRSREVELKQNRFWLGWLSTAYRYGDDPAIVLDPTLMTNRMTAANVKAAAKRYLDTKQYYQAVMLPEK